MSDQMIKGIRERLTQFPDGALTIDTDASDVSILLDDEAIALMTANDDTQRQCSECGVWPNTFIKPLQVFSGDEPHWSATVQCSLCVKAVDSGLWPALQDALRAATEMWVKVNNQLPTTEASGFPGDRLTKTPDLCGCGEWPSICIMPESPSNDTTLYQATVECKRCNRLAESAWLPTPILALAEAIELWERADE